MREGLSRSHPAEGVLIFRDQPTIVFVTICSRKRRSQLANDSVHNALVESWSTAVAWLVGFYLIMPDIFICFAPPTAKITHLNAGFHSGNAGCAASSERPKHCFKRTAFITDCGEMRTILKNGSMYGRIPFARDWFLILINGLTKASLTNYLGGTDGGSAERRPTGDRREHNW